VLASLRYFHEQMPGLHVVAAGSLLEFALQKIPSLGVGRITSRFMYPLTFPEFLEAVGEGNRSSSHSDGRVDTPRANAWKAHRVAMHEQTDW
jgi:predicted AAA+ superfamily ATPase